MIAYWSTTSVAPWQDERWLDDMRESLRPNQCARMIENKWVASEDVFIPLSEWDACTDPTQVPIFSDPALHVYAGVDARTKHDSTAIAAVAWG